MLVVLLAICALAIDLGNVYVCYQALKSSTNAAALAAGEAIPLASSTANDPVTVAKQFSGSPANGAIYNLHPNFLIDTVTATPKCISTTTYPNIGLLPCNTYYTPDGNINAIQVTETGKVPTYFAKIFGVSSVPITATSTASAKGGANPPYNIMVVLDGTVSMSMGQDTGCISNNTGLKLTPEQCAQEGIQTLLTGLTPCGSALGNCNSGNSGLGQNAVDEVGLMVFPGICGSTTTGLTTAACPQATTLTDTVANSTYASLDYQCPPPRLGAPLTTYNNSPDYLVLPFQNNYRISANSGLNTGSNGANLVNAVGAVTDGSCTGINAATTNNTIHTFYAGVITSAEDYLAANSRVGAQNVMIFLSDGDANACGSAAIPCTGFGYYPTQPDMKGTVKNTTAITGMQGGLWSPNAECQQAVNAANWAKTNIPAPGIAPTIIYSISYGSEVTGCASTGDTINGAKATPCATMSGIASLPLAQHFFSVPQTVGGKASTVCSGAAPITQLDQVFTNIQAQLSTSRLIPNGLQ